MIAGPREHVSAAVAAFDRTMDADDRVPLIAAVNGAAIGGGFEVALRCDLVVAAEHAKFHLVSARPLEEKIFSLSWASADQMT